MEKLMALYGISSPSGREGKMAKFIIEELKRMEIPFRQDRYGNIYAVKGNRESYPCVVAHMDEVHRRKTGSYAAHLVADSMIVGYDHKRKRMTGIGADDKNGIWICLKCLEDCKMVKCAFFVQEEVGCIGSSHADMSFFSDCRFVIQCDRKGNGDMVTQINGMKLCSNEFISAIDFRKYGYKPAQGLNTDVADIDNKMAEVQKKASEGSLFDMVQPPVTAPQPSLQQSAPQPMAAPTPQYRSGEQVPMFMPEQPAPAPQPVAQPQVQPVQYRQPAPQPVPQQAAPQPQDIQFHQPVQVPQPQLADNRWIQQPAPSQYATVQEAAMYNFDKDYEDDRELLREDPYAEYPDFPKECRMTDMAQMDMVYC